MHEAKTPALWQVKRVRAITLAGGNPSTFIIRQSGSEIQYRLYMLAYKILGIDRPAIRRWRPLSDEKRNEIISDYAAGMPIKDIVAKYDIADSQIYQSMRIMETQQFPFCFYHDFLLSHFDLKFNPEISELKNFYEL